MAVEAPNFEAIIAFGNIGNVSGYRLSIPQDTVVYQANSRTLIADAGLPQGAIQASQYELLRDPGVHQGLVNPSNYQLLPIVGIWYDANFKLLAPVLFMVLPDNEGMGGGIPQVGGRVKVWDGVAWQLKSALIWNGSAFNAKPVKIWNGSAWVLSAV